VPFEAAARMIELAIERVDTPSLGLQAGANLSAHAMHVVGALLQASGTLREAHTLIERFERLVYDGANHSLAVIDGGAHYRYIHAADTPAERFVVDLALAFTLRTVQHLLLRSDLEPSVARLTYARPDDAAEYEQVFGCPVEFGAEFNEFVIPAELLELPLMHSDARLAELLERRATELLAAIDGEADLTLACARRSRPRPTCARWTWTAWRRGSAPAAGRCSGGWATRAPRGSGSSRKSRSGGRARRC
jgi:hypothetical protein